MIWFKLLMNERTVKLLQVAKNKRMTQDETEGDMTKLNGFKKE